MNDKRNEEGAQSVDDTFLNWREDCLLLSSFMSHSLQFLYSCGMSILWGGGIALVALLISFAFGPRWEEILGALINMFWLAIPIAFFVKRYKPTRYVTTGSGYNITLDLNGWQIGGWRRTCPESGWIKWMWPIIWLLLRVVKRGIILNPGDHGALGILTYTKVALGGPTLSAPCPALSVIDDESTIPNARVTVHTQDGGDPEISGSWACMNPWQIIRRATQFRKLEEGLDAIWNDVVNVSTSFLRQAFADITLSQIKQSHKLDADLNRALMGVEGDDQDQRVRKIDISGVEQTTLDMENGIVLYNLHVNDVFLPKGMMDAMNDQGTKRYVAQGKAAAMELTRAALEAIPDAKLREDVLIVEEHLSGQEVSRNRLEIEVDLGVPEDRASEAYKHIADIAKSPAATVLATQAALRKGKGSATRKSDKDKKKG